MSRELVFFDSVLQKWGLVKKEEDRCRQTLAGEASDRLLDINQGDDYPLLRGWYRIKKKWLDNAPACVVAAGS
jgi:hypothetical protein